MLRASLALLVALAGVARAEVVVDAPPPQAPESDFWREIVEPHAETVNAITLDVQMNLFTQLDAGYGYDDQDPSDGDQLQQKLAVALGELKRARKLAPANVLVLSQLGRVADLMGNTRQALDALQTAVDVVGPENASPEITGRLGSIYLRLGELDEAIRYLRAAQAWPAPGAEALIDLSTALALRGEMTDAIEVLTGALPHNYDYTAEQWSIAFALAVQYDRNDERGAAFETLDKLQGMLADNNYGGTMQSWIAGMRFVPAEDQHYYSALLYESLGDYTEARIEWTLYAGSGGAFRARALQHVAAIDAERRVHPGIKPAPGQLTGPQGQTLPPPPPPMVHMKAQATP